MSSTLPASADEWCVLEHAEWLPSAQSTIPAMSDVSLKGAAASELTIRSHPSVLGAGFEPASTRGGDGDVSVIPSMSEASIAKVREWTDRSLREWEQYPFITEHRLHAGMYARTVTIPAPPPEGTGRATGVLVKIPTILILCGDVIVYMGEDEPPLHVNGQNVLLGSAGRKQAFIGRSAFTMTMCFATKAKTVSEAQAEFTDEIELLWPLSDTERHDIIVTGE